MKHTYFCYLHTKGHPTPDLQLVVCPSRKHLPNSIREAVPEWERFDLIDVYDYRGRPVLALPPGDDAKLH